LVAVVDEDVCDGKTKIRRMKVVWRVRGLD
jgi:hypothetical protein